MKLLLFSSLSNRVRQQLLKRLTPSVNRILTQKNTYIFPSTPGWYLLLTTMLLLLASINFQLNLGYLLTFLVGGSAFISLYLTFYNLEGLELSLRPPPYAYAQQTTTAQLVLHDKQPRKRYGIAVSIIDAPPNFFDYTTTPTVLDLSHVFPQRGIHPWPFIHLETHFPIGVFRAWTWWRTSYTVVVYPQPENSPPPLPQQGNDPNAGYQAQATNDELDGLRSYQNGDRLNRILWKKTWHDEWLVKTSLHGQTSYPIRFSLESTRLKGEAAISRLCAWLQIAHQQQLAYELQLPTVSIPAGTGAAHFHNCLKALAELPSEFSQPAPQKSY